MQAPANENQKKQLMPRSTESFYSIVENAWLDDRKSIGGDRMVVVV